MWLHSSVGRASHRYRGGHGFESRWCPIFFFFFPGFYFPIAQIGKFTAMITLHFSIKFFSKIKLQISPLKLEGSKSSPSFLLTAIINSLIYSLSSFGGISSILLLSFLELRNSVSKLTSLRVFERVFLFFWSSINLSIGLSGDTNLLDCSAILKNIS